jgi:hypothetical protein
MEATRSSRTLILTRPTQHHIPEDGILQDNQKFSSNAACEAGHALNNVNYPETAVTRMNFLMPYVFQQTW